MEDLFGKCPYVTAQRLFGGKWTMIIFYYLSCTRTLRFSELLRKLPELTQATLTKQLRMLENAGLVCRTVYAEVPPRVEYALSELGKEFLPVLSAYETFGKTYICYLNERNK